MSEPIEFPLNFERFMEMGKLALAEGQLDEAFLNFEEAYNLQEDFQANRLLVTVLMAKSEFLEAKKIADEMKLSYLSDSQGFETYLTLLVGAHYFIQGRKLVRKCLFSENVKVPVLSEIEQGEQFFRKFQSKELIARKEMASAISDSTFYQQGSCLRELERLPEQEYVSVAKYLIEQQSLPLLLNNGLIESLVELGVKTEFVSRTINGVQKVNSGELPLANKQKSYLASKESLLAQLENNDSEMSRSLLEELRLHFTLLYPLADELIKEPELWVKLFLASYFGQTFDQLSVVGKKYMTFQQLLRHELAVLSI